MEHQIPKMGFGPCCFCGKDIDSVDPDPCCITVTTARDEGQMWWCHAKCFRERLLTTPEGYPEGFLDPEYF